MEAEGGVVMSKDKVRRGRRATAGVGGSETDSCVRLTGRGGGSQGERCSMPGT